MVACCRVRPAECSSTCMGPLKEVTIIFITSTTVSVQFSSSVMSDSFNPMNRSTPGLPVHHQLPEFTQTHVHRVSEAIQASHALSSLLLLSLIPPSIRVFSNESTLHMRWPKYWSFSFSIIPSKEHPGLFSFRMHWLDLLAVQGILMASPITPWQIDGETVETVSDFIFLGSKITADGDCSHEIERCLLLERKVMTNLDSILKSRDITLPTKWSSVDKAMVFPEVMYGCESWTIKKAEC